MRLSHEFLNPIMLLQTNHYLWQLHFCGNCRQSLDVMAYHRRCIGYCGQLFCGSGMRFSQLYLFFTTIFICICSLNTIFVNNIMGDRFRSQKTILRPCTQLKTFCFSQLEFINSFQSKIHKHKIIVQNVKNYLDPTTISSNYIHVFQIQFYMFQYLDTPFLTF